MKKLFDQSQGSTAHTTNMLSLARSFGLHDNEVVYAKAGTKLTNVKGIYDSKSSTFWLLPKLIGSELFSFTAPVLITDKETIDLTEHNITFDNFHVMHAYDFSIGFTITNKTQVVAFENELYRWNGEIQKVVPPSSTIASTGGVSENTWVRINAAYNEDLVFTDIAEMKNDTSLQEGNLVKTNYYSAASKVGGTTYVIRKLSEIKTSLNNEDWIPDNLTTHALHSDLVAYPLNSFSIDVTVAGAVPDLTTDSTASFNSAINFCKHVTFTGAYLIDPSVSILLKDGLNLIGSGQQNSILLAKYNVAGNVIKRSLTEGVSNPRVENILLDNFSVFLNHEHKSTVPANIQHGINLRDVSRSTVQNCFVGNYRTGKAAELYPNASNKVQAMRGNLIILANHGASDPAYSGGEVNKIINCRCWWGKKGIVLDDYDITSGASASYAAIIDGCDIQTVEKGIAQETRYNAGCSFINNVIQDLKSSAGSTDPVYAYMISGYNNRIYGGYVETSESTLTACIYLDTAAKGNVIDAFYHTVGNAKFLVDRSAKNSNNIVKFFSTDDSYHSLQDKADIAASETVAHVTFDSGAGILSKNNLTSVVRNGAGDYNIVWDASAGLTDNSTIQVTLQSNASSHPALGFVRSHSGGTTRISTYNIQTSVYEDFPKIHVQVIR